MSALRITVAGWTKCGFFQKAWAVTSAMTHLYPNRVQAVKIELENRELYQEWLKTEKPKLQLTGGAPQEKHTSSPLVFIGDNQYVGGCDAILEYIKQNIVSAPTATRSAAPPNVKDTFNEEEKYDFDLVCIGGGSGGLAMSKAAADLGAKVACLDYVKPSQHGTTWGLGGTCVNVGCIPKKLCHRAAILGEEINTDSKVFGWELGEATHNWETLQTNVHSYIKSLNFKYRVALRDKKVKYINKLGRIVDANTLELSDKKGKVEIIKTKRIVIAVGGRPTPLGCPGAEYAIDSDDIFQMDWTKREGSKTPGKTLVVGAGYVALECAGFFTALGYDTTVMVRSVLLRGFDREYCDKIGEYMEATHTKFLRETVPSKIVKEGEQYRVFFAQGETDTSDLFDTVVAAVGRTPDTSKLGLENAGVKIAKSGKIICENNNEQTNIPNIYAIGDVVEGMLELTPVAIQAGIFLAKRLYGESTQMMDYDLIPTTVFTPIEYGAIGLSEEDAIKKYGAKDIEVFHKELAPLEWALSNEQIKELRPGKIARCKLICVKSDNLKVVGFHVLCPNAGEVTQGFATAMLKGATYKDFQDTVGIHPTVAEDFTTLTITKSSGKDAGSGGC